MRKGLAAVATLGVSAMGLTAQESSRSLDIRTELTAHHTDGPVLKRLSHRGNGMVAHRSSGHSLARADSSQRRGFPSDCGPDCAFPCQGSAANASALPFCWWLGSA